MTTVPLLVDPSNADQARAWDGAEGTYWAGHPDAFDRTMAGYDPGFLAAAALYPGDQVLDVGCGTGLTTRAAARLCAPGRALGVDLSGRMIEVARGAADRAGLINASFEQADAQVHDFGAGLWDVVLSRTGVMFFGRPAAGFANLRRALRPGGRLVLLVWQPYERNEWIQVVRTALAAGRDLPAPPPDAPGPFALGDPDRLRSLLAGAGFAGIELADVRQPMDFGPDAGAAYDFLTGLLGWMVAGLDDAARSAALATLRRTLERHATAAGVRLGSAAWLVTARA